MNNPVTVLVGFGASSPEARAVYSHIEEAVRRHRPDHEVRWAYTSGRIAAKLRELGVTLPTVEETIAGLAHRSAVFQPLLTVPGQEYAKLSQLAGNGFRIGRPLLDDAHSIDEVIAAIESAFLKGSVNVLVCHGNRRHAEYNSRLLALACAVERRHANVVVASVEGSPGLAPLERAREMARAAGSVHFVPFMLAAGEHIVNDVMGGHAESWKNRIGAAHVSCAPSLGWNPQVLAIYLRRLDAALDELKGQADGRL